VDRGRDYPRVVRDAAPEAEIGSLKSRWRPRIPGRHGLTRLDSSPCAEVPPGWAEPSSCRAILHQTRLFSNIPAFFEHLAQAGTKSCGRHALSLRLGPGAYGQSEIEPASAEG